MSEALTRLGADPGNSPQRNYVVGRLRKLGISISHFEREGVRWTKEILQSAVTASTSMNEVLRRLGVELVGGQHTHISRRVRALGIDTSHFSPQARTDSPLSNPRRRSPEEILVENDSPHARRTPSSRLKRALLELGLPDQCALCGCESVWRGRPLPLEVDHIDGNWRDTQRENLRLLCPNCHATTDSYRRSGRSVRSTDLSRGPC
ncbi:HNH endonuclease signature motif containing protein [Streptomyces sp. NPDC088725]|uniref:HNH endonuclease signature motif containing protein n=1 Tax=Streptomyces sp. NPDC088725 TaxID=3365873 RepID=UPI0037F8DE88